MDTTPHPGYCVTETYGEIIDIDSNMKWKVEFSNHQTIVIKVLNEMTHRVSSLSTEWWHHSRQLTHRKSTYVHRAYTINTLIYALPNSGIGEGVSIYKSEFYQKMKIDGSVLIITKLYFFLFNEIKLLYSPFLWKKIIDKPISIEIPI